LLVLGLHAALAGCGHNAAAEQLMTIEQCREAKHCVIKGELALMQVGDVTMGRLQAEDRKCLNVSLPPGMIESLQKTEPREMTLRGTILPVPTDIEVATISVNQRKIGLGPCGNFYLYVE
jgi:hypothetical protein